ncbi:hypothetical protein BR93DRAFT_196962 [Coniochaeta sp. PMI_546]|nr:hypothetical protein BR93DRAFT_196962 [Coniochaeta sp. PMI_546]
MLRFGGLIRTRSIGFTAHVHCRWITFIGVLVYGLERKARLVLCLLLFSYLLGYLFCYMVARENRTGFRIHASCLLLKLVSLESFCRRRRGGLAGETDPVQFIPEHNSCGSYAG